MKNKRKLCSIALTSTVLFFISLILISAAASAAQVTKIGNGSDPAVYGNKAVWTNGGVIHVYDLNSKTGTTVSSSEASYPDIYGNKLVWYDESSGTPRLTVYDIPTASRSYITQDVDQYSRPAIYGNRIVWSANFSVYMRDISTSTQTQITSGESPDIYDTKIAYSYDNGDMPRIYVYDVITKEAITASPYSGHLYQPHIYGNKVIWSDFYTRLGHISMSDIATNKTIDVTSAHTYSGDPDNPDAGEDTGTHININGDKIVYSKSGDDQFGNEGVYVYDIPTGQSKQLYNYPKEVYTTPDVYENIVVWGIKGDYDGSTNSNDIYVCDLEAESTKPTATFTANVTSGVAPLKVQFTSEATGNPTEYYWVFEPSASSDWNSHHSVTAAHTFTNPGIYTVTLTVSNDAGTYTATKEGYITVTDASGSSENIPVASFSANVTSGTAPLVVLFTDTSTSLAPTSWLWDFGEGTTSKHAMNATHTFTKPGNYEISLNMESATGNATVIKANYIIVTAPAVMDPNAPVPDFSSSVTKGYAPLPVQFTDLSQNVISRAWDFNNDGQTDSGDINPVYMYTSPGTYTANLTVSNANGTASKTATITVLKDSSSSGGNGHSSGSSGGSGGGSPEPAKNVEVKELSQAFITSGKAVTFYFTKNATCVVYVSFDAKKTLGKTTTIAEMLKGKSALVSELPSGEVYKSFNIWVGNGGVASSKNIENPLICFKVEKTWMVDKKIDQASIALNRYNEKKWEQLPVNLSGEDEKFLYFTAETPGFSSFAVTGTAKKATEAAVKEIQSESKTEIINKNDTGNKGIESENQTEQKTRTSAPGFEIGIGVASLLAIFLYKRK